MRSQSGLPTIISEAVAKAIALIKNRMIDTTAQKTKTAVKRFLLILSRYPPSPNFASNQQLKKVMIDCKIEAVPTHTTIIKIEAGQAYTNHRDTPELPEHNPFNLDGRYRHLRLRQPTI